MGLKQKIFRYLDDGVTTLVFSTETTARHYLSLYVRERKTSILADRAVALDVFKAMFAPVHISKPSNKYYRLAFVSDLLSQKKSGLNYLYKDEFQAYKSRFIPFLTKILPSLSQMESTHIKSKELYHDLKTLEEKYTEYLMKNNLFEPGWEKHSIDNYKGPKLQHVLIGYDMDIQMQKLISELGTIDGIEYLSLEENPKHTYLQYSTEEAEIIDLIGRLNELKLKKIPTSDIIISCAALNTLRPRLERKALENNIPLVFMRSINLPDTVPVRYLMSVKACIDQNLDFPSLEGLLLNTALPYKDMDINRRLIRFMIDKNIQGGNLNMKDDMLMSALASDATLANAKASRVLSEYITGGQATSEQATSGQATIDQETEDKLELIDFYKGLKSKLASIKKESDAESLIRDLHLLTIALFGNEEFNQTTEQDKNIFSFILSELTNLGKILSEVTLPMRDIFSIFMDEVCTLSYVPQTNSNAIRVYDYGQDQMLYVPYHFVVGLNDTNSQMVENSLEFLNDHEVASRTTFDVTEKLIQYYCLSGDNVYISGSELSFDGSASSPIFFILNNSVQKVSKEQQVAEKTEKQLEKADYTSYLYAKQTALAEHGADLSKGELGLPKEVGRLSYTSINSYVRCPYSTFLGMQLLNNAPDDFEPAKQDDKEIGNLLHNVIQKFMANHFNQMLTENAIDDYHEEIEKIMDKKLLEDRNFDQFTKECIKGNFLEGELQVVDGLLRPQVERGKETNPLVGPFIPLKNELNLNSNPSYIGRIDTVIMDQSHEIHLIDYKKSSAKETYQLILYKQLYEEDPRCSGKVGKCLFYSMKDKKFYWFKKTENWDEQSQQLKQDIETLKQGYQSGNWKATPSDDSCKYCLNRSICRRRFNLQ